MKSNLQPIPIETRSMLQSFIFNENLHLVKVQFKTVPPKHSSSWVFIFPPTFNRFSIIFFFLFRLSIFPQITADIHLIFVFGSHLGFFFLVTGILLRFIFGPLPFFLVFFLVQVMVGPKWNIYLDYLWLSWQEVIDINLEIQFGERVGPKLVWPEAYLACPSSVYFLGSYCFTWPLFGIL